MPPVIRPPQPCPRDDCGEARCARHCPGCGRTLLTEAHTHLCPVLRSLPACRVCAGLGRRPGNVICQTCRGQGRTARETAPPTTSPPPPPVAKPKLVVPKPPPAPVADDLWG